MKRRNFFLLSLAGLATIAVPSYLVWKSREDKINPLCEPKILTTILEPSAIVEIGLQYRRQFPESGLEKKLEEMLGKNMDLNNSTIEDLLENKIKRDYERGNTVMLDGWILSETEAIQCALLSISESNLS
ncbi:hypothetical protein [Sediminicola sp. 1XM1-17]|uniref:hypothetical protein n=1 Tax=Sediminicola sp. 1XM1-17 TaxID=3127702 RepID=UPI0030775FD0